jgi:hypothetical protein
VAALGREGSSADVRLGGAGSGDSACRTDTMVPVLGGGRGGARGGGRGELGDGCGGAPDGGLAKRRLGVALGW